MGEVVSIPTGDGTRIHASAESFEAASKLAAQPGVLAAAMLVLRNQRVSTSEIQSQLSIGFNAAAKIVDVLEELGVVSSPDNVGARDVLITELPEPISLAVAINDLVVKAVPEPTKRTRGIPMKETAADVAVRDAAFNVAGEELRSFIERFERLAASIADLASDQKEVMAEAKGRGYDTKIMRKVIALRKRDKDAVAEENAVLDMYLAALGML